MLTLQKPLNSSNFIEDGYTEKNITEIYHNHLIKDFIGIEKIVSKYL